MKWKTSPPCGRGRSLGEGREVWICWAPPVSGNRRTAAVLRRRKGRRRRMDGNTQRDAGLEETAVRGISVTEPAEEAQARARPRVPAGAWGAGARKSPPRSPPPRPAATTEGKYPAPWRGRAV